MGQEEKIYVGRAKYIATRYGELCKVWITPDGLDAINRNAEPNGGINLNLSEMRQPDRGGFTHVLTVDTYKREGSADRGRHVRHSDAGRERRREEYDEPRRRRAEPEEDEPVTPREISTEYGPENEESIADDEIPF